MLPYHRFVAPLLVLVIAACGGGGSDSSDVSELSNDTGPSATLGLGKRITESEGFDPFTGGVDTNALLPANNQSFSRCDQVLAVDPGSTLTGQVQYQRVPLGSIGLDYSSIIDAPARGIVVEALAVNNGQCSNQPLARTVTDANGNYGLNVPLDTPVCLQAVAQMFRSGSDGGAAWNIQVTDNTQANQVYRLSDGLIATPRSQSVRNLLADSGWNGLRYSRQRSAASFAILDTACHALNTFLDADETLQLDPLFFRWSVNNAPIDGEVAEGDIGGAHYSYSQQLNAQNQLLNEVHEIFLLGLVNADTDEYDQHVIAHEIGHFLMAQVSRSDSLGGGHALSDRLDMTVAYSEGWSDAFSGIALAKAPSSHLRFADQYQDVLGFGQTSAFKFSLQQAPVFTSVELPVGWYSESSNYQTLYNLMDSDNSGVDTLTMPFSAIYHVLTQLADSEAFNTLYSFSHYLKQDNLADSSAIDNLLAAVGIEPIEDSFGTTESLIGQDDTVASSEDVLPIYTPLILNQAKTVCSNPQFGGGNKLSVIQYLFIDIPTTASYALQISPQTGAYEGGRPAAEVYRQGQFVSGYFMTTSTQLEFDVQLASGRHIIAIYDVDNLQGEPEDHARHCFSIRVD